LNAIGALIIEAKKIGQRSFLEKLVFTYTTMFKEQNLLANGIDTFCYKDDIKLFLDRITPKNSIKIIELERYPRPIPIDVMKKIQTVQKKELFDDYFVVFTDFTGVKTGTSTDYATRAEKQFIQRNKDPIVFGFFQHKETGLKHDRVYYIADWEDDHCDLTFTKMVEKMEPMKMESSVKTISTNQEYLDEIVNNTLQKMKTNNRYGRIEPEINNESFWTKFWPLKKKTQ
jgi:hypothetical protein